MPDTKKYMKSIKFGTQGDTYYVKDEEAVAKQQDPQDAGKVLTIGQDGVVVPAAGGGTGAVSSVNGKTGAVVLTSTDVDAADAGQFSAHVNNDNIHVSTEDRQNWNGKADNSALTDHTGDTTIHVTSSDKTTWSGKQDKLTSANAGTNVTITEESGVVKINATGGSGGTTNYNDLTNKPAIDGTTLASDSTAAGLGLAKTTDVYTKAEADSEFLSSNSVDVITDNNYSDIIIEDDNGNALVQFAEGHIRTKNFDSRNVSTPNIPFLDLSGKTVGFLGDSITYGVGASSTANRYSTLFCSIANCTERNLGNSGTCLAANTKNGRTSERFITRVTSANITGLDLLIIFGGTNDFSYDIKAVGDHFAEETITGNTYRGTKRRVANPDNETFSGALHELILAIRAINPALPIVYLTPLSRGVYNTTDPRGTSYETNANGDYLSDFTNAIKDICAHYSIPVFYTVDHFPYDLAQDVKNSVVTGLSTDAIHPNDKGHAILAQTLYKWIITNISI